MKTTAKTVKVRTVCEELGLSRNEVSDAVVIGIGQGHGASTDKKGIDAMKDDVVERLARYAPTIWEYFAASLLRLDVHETMTDAILEINTLRSRVKILERGAS